MVSSSTPRRVSARLRAARIAAARALSPPPTDAAQSTLTEVDAAQPTLTAVDAAQPIPTVVDTTHALEGSQSTLLEAAAFADAGAESDYGSDFDASDLEVAESLLPPQATTITAITAKAESFNPVSQDPFQQPRLLTRHGTPLSPSLVPDDPLPAMARTLYSEHSPIDTTGIVGDASAIRAYHHTRLPSEIPPEFHHPEAASIQTRLVHDSVSAYSVLPRAQNASSNTDELHSNVPPEIESEVSETATADLSESVLGELRRRSAEADERRPPLRRFRSYGSLSVTDLSSPAWCELQFHYSLARHGRVRATPAMQAGRAVHQKLEEEVHQTVEIAATTREDAFGLKIWNVIQGLRTLRATGQTRELQVWAVLEGGTPVTGIIDELSYTCPDPKLEAQAEQKKQNNAEKPSSTGKQKQAQREDGQTSIENFFASSKNPDARLTGSLEPSNSGEREPPYDVGMSLKAALQASSQPSGEDEPSTKRIYITDVKTRATRSLPRASAFRATSYQLMLYHMLLSDLISGNVDAKRILAARRLDMDQTFSDGFLAEVSGLVAASENDADDGEESEADMAADDEDAQHASTDDAIDVLLAHNTLRSLWGLMVAEVQRTFVHGPASLGSVLQVEYRTPGDGSLLGTKAFLNDREAAQAWVAAEMQWWRGERPPQGVSVEEGYKCRMCEFADDCEWRKQKVDEARDAYRERAAHAAASAKHDDTPAP